MQVKETFNRLLSESDEFRTGVDLIKDIKSRFVDGEIYIVGGPVRDIVLGLDVADIDLATNIPVSELKRFYKLKEISKDDSQPVYTICWGNFAFDLAKFREDSGDVGRSNNVSTEVNCFRVDSSRRDATINALGMDEFGNIIDHQNGLEDIKNKVIRCVGDPKKRFLEDATRILRVFRFAAKLGFEIESETFKAACDSKHLLRNPHMISNESISRELYKAAYSGKSLAKFVESLQEVHILHHILPELTDMEGFTHNPKHHPEGGSTVLGHIYEAVKASPSTDPVVNLAVLFHDVGKGVTRGEKNGHSTYYGHEGAGVGLVKKIFNRLNFNDLSVQDKRHILVGVAKHMNIHRLSEMNINKVSKMILDDSWELLKTVGYSDEASRGEGLFDENAFWAKINVAEERVSKLGKNYQECNKNLKKYIDGNKLFEWHPELRDAGGEIGRVLNVARDFLIGKLTAGEQINESELKLLVKETIDNK